MYALDFEYDGKYLSDFGFIICDFNAPSGANISSAGSVITFDKVARNKGKKWSLTNTTYDECIQTTFDVCKNPDLFEDMTVSDDEYKALFRWLNRREFLRFQVFNEDGQWRAPCYYMASFNVSKVKINEILYGLELQMETDKPFGYSEPHKVVFDITDTSKKYLISDTSDEVGSICASMKVTCKSSGDLSIKNDFDDVTMVVKNCKEGEVITIDGETMQISSSIAHERLYNDFNYRFLRISNSYYKRNNNITASIPCKIEISYSPIVKDSP